MPKSLKLKALELPPSLSDPFRPPDWRYLRAMWFIKHEANKGPDWSRLIKEDPITEELLDFLKEIHSARTAYKLLTMRSKKPSLYNAYSLYMHDNTRLKAIIEARILANEPINEISIKTGLTEATIKDYESNFFDVKDRLKMVDWVLTTVLSRDTYESRDDFAYLVKFFAYFGGSEVLNYYLTYHTEQPTLAILMRNLLQTELFSNFRKAVSEKPELVIKMLPPSLSLAITQTTNIDNSKSEPVMNNQMSLEAFINQLGLQMTPDKIHLLPKSKEAGEHRFLEKIENQSNVSNVPIEYRIE